MFEPLQLSGKLAGHGLYKDGHFYFFGTRHLTRDQMLELFPQYRFCFLKQVHGRKVVPAQVDIMPEADAHFTNVPGLAMVIQTADCLPILLGATGHVVALHAGWRGLQQNIIQAVTQSLPGIDRPVAILGPHIGACSFEVSIDVATQLASIHPDGVRLPQNVGKVLVDLSDLARAQLRTTFTSQIQILEHLTDTKTSPDYFSYRRDGPGRGRQYSFVVINA